LTGWDWRKTLTRDILLKMRFNYKKSIFAAFGRGNARSAHKATGFMYRRYPRLTAGLLILCLFSGGIYPFGKRDESGKKPVIQEDKPAQVPEPHKRSLYDTAVQGQVVEITGIIRLVGNEPFNELVITEEGRQTWYIEGENRAILSRYQQRNVTIRGTVELQEMVLANGKYLGIRRILKDVSLMFPLEEGF
jgi:hypothetical protein